MIIGTDRLPVIDNIKKRVKDGELNAKVELSDPMLSAAEEKAITDRYLKDRNSLSFRLKSSIAGIIVCVGGYFINKNTEIVGKIDPEVLKSGVIVTSNHFSPLENTVIRTYLRKN